MTIADDEVNLQCPLCNYSLRGLVDPRCPECGFTFEWAELREAARNKHPYLFEHGAGHNLRTFWLTFWRDWRPRKFWRELSPAHPIRLRRMMVYWMLSNVFLLMVIPVSIGIQIFSIASDNAAERAWMMGPQLYSLRQPNVRNLPASPALAAAHYPPITDRSFWSRLPSKLKMPALQAMPILIGLLWPWLTLLSLLVFQGTMRRVNIRNIHLVRCGVYCGNFPLAIACCIAVMVSQLAPIVLTMVLPLLMMYRLTFANSRYLRFDWPMMTALSSQIIVTLTIWCFIANMHLFY